MSNTQSVWREKKTTVASGTTATQQSDVVPPGEQWYCAWVVVRDQTSPNSNADLSIDSGGSLQEFGRLATTTANVAVRQAVELWLREGEQLRFAWSSVINADVLDVFIHGIKRKVG